MSFLGSWAILGIVSEDEEFWIWRMKSNIKSVWYLLSVQCQVAVRCVSIEMKRPMLWENMTTLSASPEEWYWKLG